MPILKIFEFPDPILKKVCTEVTIFDAKLESFINDLIETMFSHKFCVGLAAPQVGNLQRIIIIDVSRARKPQPGNDLLVLINPVEVSYSLCHRCTSRPLYRSTQLDACLRRQIRTV